MAIVTRCLDEKLMEFAFHGISWATRAASTQSLWSICSPRPQDTRGRYLSTRVPDVCRLKDPEQHRRGRMQALSVTYIHVDNIYGYT